MFYNPFHRLLLILVTGSLLFLGACSSGHDHYSAIGIVLTIDGDMIAVQEQTVITYATGNAITIPAGATTAAIKVQFLDDDGTPFTPERSGYSLRVTIGNPAVLDVAHPVNNDEWSIRLTGSQPGNTTLQFDLDHGDHSDFTSREFQVNVLAPQADVDFAGNKLSL